MSLEPKFRWQMVHLTCFRTPSSRLFLFVPFVAFKGHTGLVRFVALPRGSTAGLSSLKIEGSKEQIEAAKQLIQEALCDTSAPASDHGTVVVRSRNPTSKHAF